MSLSLSPPRGARSPARRGFGYSGLMTLFHEFLTGLLDEGRIVFRSARAPHDRPAAQDVAILERAYESYRLAVAGPGIPFDPAVAYSAAELIRQASWALVNHGDRVSDLKKCLTMPIEPTTPAHHLSADLMLRYLPQIHRRARGLDPCDPLIDLLEGLLRRWPLSGVLSDVAQPPLAPLAFGEHPGLMLLYAERLAANDRPAWRPVRPGTTWDYYELVIEEQDREKAKSRETLVHLGRGADLG
jgi:MoxR-vWA-beta-propeller ternary system protein